MTKTGMKAQKNRRLLFGYKICDGERAIHEVEGSVVQWIFKQNECGFSYQQIADKLDTGNIPYRADDCKWNKNMVQRILSREEYCGMNEYPKLIECEQYERVKRISQKKASVRAVKKEIPKEIRRILKCSNCGSGLHREKSGKVMNWQCRGEARTTQDYITDEVLMKKLMQKTNKIIEKLDKINIQPERSFEQTLSMMQKNNEIVHHIQDKTISDEEIQNLIFQAAAERYQGCQTSDTTYYTKQLLEIYGQIEPLSEPDLALIQHTVRNIYLTPDGELRFEMINGKLI